MKSLLSATLLCRDLTREDHLAEIHRGHYFEGALWYPDFDEAPQNSEEMKHPKPKEGHRESKKNGKSGKNKADLKVGMVFMGRPGSSGLSDILIIRSETIGRSAKEAVKAM